MTDKEKSGIIGLGLLGLLAWLFTSSEEDETKTLSGVDGNRDVEAGGMTFTRIDNDVNGNPRYVIHYLNLLKEGEFRGEIQKGYAAALKRAKKIGGKKFSNKQYGGGIVFQSYNIDRTAEQIKELLNDQPKKLSGKKKSKKKLSGKITLNPEYDYTAIIYNNFSKSKKETDRQNFKRSAEAYQWAKEQSEKNHHVAEIWQGHSNLLATYRWAGKTLKFQRS